MVDTLQGEETNRWLKVRNIWARCVQVGTLLRARIFKAARVMYSEVFKAKTNIQVGKLI